MNLTTICCTGDRPEAFELYERYLARQTVKPFQMLVLDDGETPTKCTLGEEYFYWPQMKGRGSMVKKIRKAMQDGLVKGDAIVFTEDDDAVSADYLAWCAENLAKYAIVGEGNNVYYNVQGRWWHRHNNMKHASLCATSITKQLFPWLLKQCTISEDPFLDVRLWNRAPGPSKVHFAGLDDRRVVGIKGMPGRAGYGTGHTEKDRSANDDPDLVVLKRLMGEDAKNYERFYIPPATPRKQTPVPAEPAPAPKPNVVTIGAPKPIVPLSDFANGHGPNWLRWLGHLKGQPATMIEIGTFRGESAEWVLTNILTHPDSVLHCVDPFTGSDEHRLYGIDCTENEKLARERLARFGDKVQFHVTTSERFLYELNANKHQPKVRAAYCDGAHDALNVLRDAVMLFDTLEVGGRLIFDDVEWKEMPSPLDRPKMAVEAFQAIYSRKLKIINPRGWQHCYEKTHA